MTDTPRPNDYQQMLDHIQALVPVDSIRPWTRRERGFAGRDRVLAAGWTRDEALLLVDYDGFRVIDPHSSGVLLAREMPEADVHNAFSPDRLAFGLPNGEDVHVFGLWGGDGFHVTDDGWVLDVVAPLWPMRTLLLCRPRDPGAALPYSGCSALRIPEPDADWVKCGFTASGRCFVLVDPWGAVVFTR